MRAPVPPVRSHVDDHLVHWLPSVAQIQGQTEGRGFDVGLGSGVVGGFEAGLDEHGAQAAAVVGWVDGEDVEDCLLRLVFAETSGWIAV